MYGDFAVQIYGEIMNLKIKGYLFTEIFIIMGIFSTVVFPMIMLMNKNINFLNYIRKEYEVKRLSVNLENIFLNLIEREKIETKYYIIQDENEKTLFILKDSEGKQITKLRNVRNISDIKIFLSEKKVFIMENTTEKELCKVFVLEIQIKDKVIRKILNR